jgi:hypothetical protein
VNTIRETGTDMMTKVKEAARGGLAPNIVDVLIQGCACGARISQPTLRTNEPNSTFHAGAQDEGRQGRAAHQ